MNTGRKIALIIVAGTLSLAAFGQAPEAPAESAASSASAKARRDDVPSRLERMSRRLNLTEDQKARITPILQDEVQQRRAVRQDTSLTPEQKRGKLRQLRDSSRAQVEAILTPEQVAKIPRPGARYRMARVARHLNLSPEQKSKMKPLLVEQHKQVQAVRSDASLTPEQKQQKVREIRKSTHQQVMALLTPEQQQQMQQMRERHQRRGMAPGTTDSPSGSTQPPASEPNP